MARWPSSLTRVRTHWLVATLLAAASTAGAQTLTPTAVLVPAPPVSLAGAVDSNSPAVWEAPDGRQILHVLTSVNGTPSLATGPTVTRLGSATPVSFASHPGHGLWMEAVIADVDGTWYGYYHNEIPADICSRPDRTIPRIGAARSSDYGQTWVDLGVILEAPPGGQVCDSPNQYFVGGVGDLSVLLNRASNYLYVFFSQYSRGPESQGVAMARLPWASRDEPVGQVAVWSAGVWVPARASTDTGVEIDDQHTSAIRWEFESGTPLVAPARAWHDSDSSVDAFWGPSVHWNTHLERYVMLLNRASDHGWGQEGIYVAYATTLDDPSTWTTPERLVAGGRWYPQVMGLERGSGSDKEAGARARLYVGGTSEYFITFAMTTRP